MQEKTRRGAALGGVIGVGIAVGRLTKDESWWVGTLAVVVACLATAVVGNLVLKRLESKPKDKP